MAERMVKSNGVELWTESFGEPGNPPLLLVMGASVQGIAWPEELIELLVAGGYYVIRYDHRDTGQSTCFDFQKNPYTLLDMAEDAVGVLDAYGIAAAHLVGASMGGMICQLVSIHHPERVLTLTLMLSTPLRAGRMETFQGRATTETLPPPAPFVCELLMAAASKPPGNRQEAIDSQVKMVRALSGSVAPFDEQECRRRVERMFDRARDPAASANHGLVPLPTREQAEALKHLRVPTLVIHGTDDPMLPPAHGVAAAEAIPGARLLMLEGLGHDLPRPLFGEIARALLAHADSIGVSTSTGGAGPTAAVCSQPWRGR
ncbi:alpha/beta hydrolase [Archangium violaceum]|uniref:alpha/beta fold hydrolase n=1 Tax=Archangium violaceum TaxID=83451 RepID=UPI00193B6B0C|nr:alpha/beta hydrolase [Archangium violaceum]QRK12158.1 alpha/beta hydrolase [Archangium violaceum]